MRLTQLVTLSRLDFLNELSLVKKVQLWQITLLSLFFIRGSGIGTVAVVEYAVLLLWNVVIL